MSESGLAPAGAGDFGVYRTRSLLGRGGMGEVWLAEHVVLGHNVALKLLLPELSMQPVMVERFFDEARAVGKIGDPGVVRVHDVGWHGERAYLAMELLEGESLGARLARVGRLAPADALELTAQAALTMAAVHDVGIVHRDLKPDNLFLARDRGVPGGERLKVLDFGIAKLLGDGERDRTRTQTGAIVGTPTYMSPEQCRNAAAVDARTDLYALGGVLFHALTGRPPFLGATAGDLIASHLLEQPPPPSSIVPGLPAELDRLVLQCLDKEPAARPPSMRALATALRERRTADLGHAVTFAGSTPSTGPLPARTGGRRGALLAVLAAVAFATGLVATWAVRSGRGRPAPGGGRTAEHDAGLVAPAGAATGDQLDVDGGAAPTAAPALDAGVPMVDAAGLAAPAVAPPTPGLQRRPRYDPYGDR